MEVKEALEAEEEEQESTYLNMMCNVDYANLMQARDQSQEGIEEGDNDEYMKITSFEEVRNMSMQCVMNKGYVSLSNAKNLMVCNGGGGTSGGDGGGGGDKIVIEI